MRAYVMITTVSERSPDIVARIRALETVKQADIVAGSFDIIAEVEAGSERELLALVTEDIQSIEGVGRTNTSIVLE